MHSRLPMASHEQRKNLDRVVQFLQTLTPDVQLTADALLTSKIQNLALDSRVINAGDAFVAIQGEQQHGLDHLGSVLDKQPGLVISDRSLTAQEQQLLDKRAYQCPVVIVNSLKSLLGEFAHWFYDQPSEHIKVVGITGTNGKTSTAFYTAQLLESIGQKTALIGTLGNGLFGALKTSFNTTPDVVQVHRLLAEFIRQGAQWVVMEVSSHALELGRIKKMTFETVALTQVTRDHIDFHGSVGAYQEAKQKLFTDYRSNHQVVNLEDRVGQQLYATAHLSNVWSYGVFDNPSSSKTIDTEQINLVCEALQLQSNGMALGLRYKEGLHQIKVPLMGRFNAENVLCALSILLSSGFEWSAILKPLAELQSVEGRMQQVSQSPTVIIDFAHTPDALEQVLTAVKQHLAASVSGALWVVFGCGGDRDQGKRPLMAKISERLADKVVLTNDNPRFEAPEDIIQQVMQGFESPETVQVELDRQVAIEKTLACASEQDIVVIAGKGHEAYQEVRGIKIPFSDRAVVQAWLKAKKDGE